MKRAFIRVVYGNCIESSRLNSEIKNIIAHPLTRFFITYVYGEDNYKYLKSLGVDHCTSLKLVSKNPWEWPNLIGLRHKIESYRIAMEDDGYDEIVFLDWDTLPTRELDSDFWDILGRKKEFQAPLYTLKWHISPWRRGHEWKKKAWVNKGSRTTINTNFFYIRDKTIPSRIIEAWETMGSIKYQGRHLQENDEQATCYFVDTLYNGWIGQDNWWEWHEPMVANVTKKSSYSDKLLKTKQQYFLHEWYN